MNQQKNQDGPSFLEGLQNEVSAENAPLLQFITKYAGAIAGIVLILLLILGGMGVWKWYHGGKQKETREELAKINREFKGADRDKALAALAEKAPESARLFIYLTLAQSAQENGDPVLAADAYARAASLGGDSALGIAGALGSAGSLLIQAKYPQALALLIELQSRLPEVAQSVEFRQMLAEAAARAGDLELAIKTYTMLADEIKTPEGGYFRARATALANDLATRKGDAPSRPQPVQSQPSPVEAKTGETK